MAEEPKTAETGASLESPTMEQSSTGADQPTPAGTASPINDDGASANTPPAKKPNGLKMFLRKFNLYLLIFAFVVVVAGAVSIVSYLNSKKTPASPDIVNKNLTADELKQLSNSNTTVGDTGQTLTVQGNAIFTGQVLVRSDLNVAGSIKLGGDLSAQNFTASGTVNLATTQIQTLQVATTTVMQGSTTLQKDLNVAGTAAFNGPVTASQITVTNLILSGNAQFRVPNHLAFTGSSPSRSINQAVLGGSGTASISGSDVSGTVNVNSGGTPGAGCFITITFNRPFSTTPHTLVTPIGAGAGAIGFYVTRTAASMTICSSSALPANQNFAFDYFVTGT
jgi:cytoskeletal protein CcmA (bactofilin family)